MVILDNVEILMMVNNKLNLNKKKKIMKNLLQIEEEIIDNTKGGNDRIVE